MSEEGKGTKSKKKPQWKRDSKITMRIAKGDLWTPDQKLKMKLQEALEKREKKE